LTRRRSLGAPVSPFTELRRGDIFSYRSSESFFKCPRHLPIGFGSRSRAEMRHRTGLVLPSNPGLILPSAAGNGGN